jgi:prevent-host-death family protein
MSVVTVHEAKAKLSELIERTLRGEEIIIAKRNKPLIRLIPFTDRKCGRRLGTAKGLVRIRKGFDDLPQGFEEYVP